MSPRPIDNSDDCVKDNFIIRLLYRDI